MDNYNYVKSLITRAYNSPDVNSALRRFEQVRKPGEWEAFAKKLESQVSRLYQEENRDQNVKSVYLNLNPTGTIYTNDFKVKIEYLLDRFKLSVYVKGDDSENQVEIFFSSEESNYTSVTKAGMTVDELGAVVGILQ